MSRTRVRPAEVVLGLTTPAQQREAERLLATDPLFAVEVEHLRATAAALEELGHTAWRPEPPPPLEADRATTVRAPRRRHRRRAAFATAAAGAMAAAVLAVVGIGGGDGPRPAVRTIALHALNGVPGRATIQVRGSEAELRGSGMPPSGPHDYYEAWLQDGSGRMVPMGTFRVARNGSVDAQMPVAVDLAHYHLIDVSLEPDDGNPAHSSVSVMRARI